METTEAAITIGPAPPAPLLRAEDVTRKAIRGAAALGVRQAFVHGANVLGSVLLARILAPADYGVYAIVTFLVAFLGTFGGTGLATNLIRMSPPPRERDYYAIFTFQQLAVAALAVALWIGAPMVASLYHAQAAIAWVFRLTAVSLIATSWMVPAQVQMERELAFQKLAVIETVQAVSFNVTAVSLALLGYGAVSFGVALCVRSLAGAVMANWMVPFCYGWVLDWNIVKRHLSFGFLFQGAQVLCLLKDSITPILVGCLMGTAGVGYVSWAMMLASYPVMALMVLKRIYLPTFAAFQRDRRELATCFERVVWLTTSVTAPVAISFLLFIRPITHLVFGAKWEAAIPLFYWFWVANAFVPVANPAVSLLNSLGEARIPTLFAFIWMAGTWLVGWPATLWMGIAGVAVATCAVQFTNLILFRLAHRAVPFRITGVALFPWLIAALSALPVWLYTHVMPIHSLATLLICIAALLAIYFTLTFLAFRKRIVRLAQVGFGGGKCAFQS